MAKKEIWDFECPQYVDFKRELDNSGKDDIFFESTFYEEEMRYESVVVTKRRYDNEMKHADYLNIKEECKDKSPENGSLSTPVVQGKSKGLTESDENRLLGKMTAALSLLENTPKIKKSASRGKLFPGSSSKKTVSKVTKSTIKSSTVPPLRPKSRRSKSLDHLNKIINKGKKCGLRKSSSLNDLKPYNKLKYPITPMCLKRTMFKAKDKIRKTTEEMELEEIAKLQKQLIQHLRQNEINLKKLNLRPRPCAVSKPKSDNLKDVKGALTGKLNAIEKQTRRNIHKLSQAGVKKGAFKLEPKIKNENVSNKKSDNTIYTRKTKALPIPSLDLSHLVPNQAPTTEEPPKQDKVTTNEASTSRMTIYSKKSSIANSPKQDKVTTNEASTSRMTIYSKNTSIADSKLNNTVTNEATSNKAVVNSRKTKAFSTADSSKLDNADNNETAACKRTILSRRAKTLSTVDSNVYKNTVPEPKKTVYKRIMDHSGLRFIPSIKNNLPSKSFIFEEKAQVPAGKQKETTALNAKENKDKENNGPFRSQFTSKETQGAGNVKHETNKLAELNRITKKRTTNHLRGTPLAENISRD